MNTLSNIDISLVPSEKNLAQIKWYLTNNTVFLGDIFIEDSIQDKFKNTFGNESCLWQETDIFRFSCKTNILEVIKLNVLSDIKIINNEFPRVDEMHENYSLKAQSITNIKNIFPNETRYYSADDVLECMYQNTDEKEELIINDSFSFLLSAKAIVGWKLGKASSFLTPITPCIKEENVKETLIAYLSICNDESYDKMDNEDTEILNFLNLLKEKLSIDSKQGKTIHEAINGLLEGYYE